MVESACFVLRRKKSAMSLMKRKMSLLLGRVVALEAELDGSVAEKPRKGGEEEEEMEAIEEVLKEEDDDDLEKKVPHPHQRKSDRKETESRVMYVGHVPHGFYEVQMEGFFGQFGEVLNVRLSRSKRTGGSKGYAFVEFEDPQVAKIAASAMDRYLMHGKQLKCHVVPLELATRPGLFDCRRVLTPAPKKPRNDPDIKRLSQKEAQKRQNINKALGFVYDYQGYAPLEDDDDEEEVVVVPDPKKNKDSRDNKRPPKSPTLKQKATTPASADGGIKKNDKKKKKRKIMGGEKSAPASA